MFLDEVWEEEQLEDDEDNEQLDEDNSPKRTPQLHGAEAVDVQVVHAIKETFPIHSISFSLRCCKYSELFLKNKHKNEKNIFFLCHFVENIYLCNGFLMISWNQVNVET
jgi:hypothetical protein